jgi:molybdopterin-guanine dinucleotide biosynthesis protein A
VLNANGDPGRFATWGLPVIGDSIQGHPGPLAGILAGMDWAAALPGAPDRMVSVPADAPFLPGDLIESLVAAQREQGAEIAVAANAGRRHPVIALWPVALAETLRHAVAVEGTHRVEAFLDRFKVAVADYPVADVDPFLNVNTEADLERAAAALDEHGAQEGGVCQTAFQDRVR